jgi:hypothetical protein
VNKSVDQCKADLKSKSIHKILSAKFDNMWWAGSLQQVLPGDSEKTLTVKEPRTFAAPPELHDLESELALLDGMTTIKKPFARSIDINGVPALLAPKPPSVDPLLLLDEAVAVAGSPKRAYWSDDKGFWRKWRNDELESRKSELERAKAKLEESQRELAAEAAAEVERRKQQVQENERKKAAAEEIEAKKVAEKAKSSVSGTASSASSKAPLQRIDSSDDLDTLLEEGKQYRTEFISFWREISLSVSATAANSRSIQQNASKLINALSRAAAQAGAMRPRIVKWLCAFCGTKIASQATSGNKSLIWSFAYLAKLVGERFPDVIRLGILGEISKRGSWTVLGTPYVTGASLDRSSHPKPYEIHARFWVALLVVLNDEISLWGWVAASVSDLLNRRKFVASTEAMWNLMKVYVFIDCGLYDFRRIFGKQAARLIQSLEGIVFPAVDAELQAISSSTNISVQFRFYLDACFNNLQSRNYQNPPEGQVLSASAESELNPDL